MIATNHDLSGLPDPIADAQFYAGVPFKRLIAWLIDFCLILLLTFGVVLGTLGIAAIVFPLTLLAVNLIYRIFLISKQSATLGMYLTGIEIRNSKGNRLSTSEAAWHTGVFTLAFMFGITSVISMVMIVFNPRGQGLHDYLLGTTAINRPSDS